LIEQKTEANSRPVDYLVGPDFVYRIQDADGRGPWKPGFSQSWVEGRQDHENLKPWYEEFGRVDQLLCTWEYAGSACESAEQLRRWFTKREYKRLRKAGYSAVKIKIGRILAISKIQCFFARNQPLNEGVETVKLY